MPNIQTQRPDISDRHGSAMSFCLVLLIVALGSYAAAQPKIHSFTPTTGIVGTTVTIVGSSFSPVAGNNIVYFGAVRGMETSATTTEIIVSVPSGATYAPITVTTGGLTAYSRQTFNVTFTGQGGIDSTSFAPRLDVNTALGPWNLAIGDLNGDGKPDIVATTNGSIS